MTDHMLSTVDNPYNPFMRFDEWNSWDQRQGYNTLAYVARVLRTSDGLSEADQLVAYETALDEIVEAHGSMLYVKIPEPEPLQPEELAG